MRQLVLLIAASAALPVIATIPVGTHPGAIGVNVSTGRVYVGNIGDGTVSVIDGATSTVIATVPVGSTGGNLWIGVNERRNRVYVSNGRDGTVHVIADALAAPTP